MKIGKEIKKYRTKRNVTQQEMAYALSITPQAVSRWEKGLSLPDISMISTAVLNDTGNREIFGNFGGCSIGL